MGTWTHDAEAIDARSQTLEPSARPTQRPSIDKLACAIIAAGATIIPLLLLLAQNGQQIADPTLVLTIAAIAAVVAGLCLAVLHRFMGWRKAALTVAAFGYTFFLNTWVSGNREFLLARSSIWLCCAVLATIAMRNLIGDSSRSLRFVATGVAMTVIALGLTGLTAHPGTAEAPTSIAFADIEPTETPNVYILVMDGLSRVDVLHRDFPGIAISPALERLEDLGFDTSETSTSNYVKTHLSMPSMLSGQYQSTSTDRLTPREEWEYATQRLSGNNPLVQTLKRAGYEYWHAQSDVWGHANCSATYADHCVSPGRGDPETRAAIWAMTPFGTGPFAPQSPVTVIDYVLENDEPSGSPRVLFAHLLSPHNPYKLDADCNSIQVGSLIEGWQESYRWMYAEETECLMRQLADSMERLVEADPDALILLLSDHGHTFGVNWADGPWSDEDVDIRFSSFRSARLPDRCRTNNADAHSLINVAEVITSCLAETDPEWQEARFFTSANDGVIEVSEDQRAILRS